MCADTLETIGDYKQYVQKIAVIGDNAYPLAIGGAGLGDPIDAAVQEITERATIERPSTRPELVKLVRAGLEKVHDEDVPALGLSPRHRPIQLLIAAKPSRDTFCIVVTKGRRIILDDASRAIIGYPTPYNHALFKRLHRDTLSMQQAVMLAVYVVSQSKEFDQGVGGSTRCRCHRNGCRDR